MSKTNVMEFVKKYTMILVLILVTAFFAWQTQGKILLPQNINNLIAQSKESTRTTQTPCLKCGIPELGGEASLSLPRSV